ncbi:MAG: ABC transporter permease [Hyphomicrobiales bacterium]|nr:MAG: ABC transporter permease [Hyphomicrobiales bacterium]
MSPYFAFATSAVMTQLAYRNEVWANLFGKLVQVFARVAIWLAIYTGATSIGGVSLEEMITYALLGGVVTGAIRYEAIISMIGRALQTGDVAVWLLKPVSFPLYIITAELGRAAYRLVVMVLPTVAVVALVYGMLPPASIFHGVMFLAYLALAYAIISLASALFGLVSFWLLTSFSLEWLMQAILNLLSGQFIPFWFFPETLGAIAAHLPFAWIVYYPAAVWLGRMEPVETLAYFGIGCGWAVLLGLGVAWLWGRASTRVIVQGG